MIGFKIVFLLFIVIVIFLLVRRTFKRTPPDDRISEEDMLVGVKPKGPDKPKSGSAKANPPKDGY